MKKSQIFDRICTRCAEVCEVRRDSILNSRCRLMSVVDARCIALSFLHRAGLSDDDVAFLALRSEQGIEWPDWSDIERRSRGYEALRRTYEDRYKLSFSFREMVRDIDEGWEDLFRERREECELKAIAQSFRNGID